MKQAQYKGSLKKNVLTATSKQYNGKQIILDKPFNYAEKEGMILASLDISECSQKMKPEHYNKGAVVLPNGEKWSVCGTNSDVKNGHVKIGDDETFAIWQKTLKNIFGYVEAFLTRIGTALDPTPMEGGFLQGERFETVNGVESGSIAFLRDKTTGEERIAVIDKGYSISSKGSDVNPWSMMPKSTSPSNIHSELDPFTPGLVDFLYDGLDEFLSSLAALEMFKTRQGAKMHKTDEGAIVRSKDDLVSLFGDVKSLDDFCCLVSSILTPEQMELIKQHPVFYEQWTKGMTDQMFRAFTGGLRETIYFKIVPGVSTMKRRQLASLRSDLIGYVTDFREPVEGVESVQAGTMTEDKTGTVPDFWEQIRLNFENDNGELIGVLKGGCGLFKNCILEKVVAPDGTVNHFNSESFFICEEDEIRGEASNVIDWTTTEVVDSFSCVLMRSEDMPELNADADGDLLGVQTANDADGNPDLYWEHVNASQKNARKHVDKMEKAKTKLVKNNNFVICQAVQDAVILGRGLGELNNYRERFLMYGKSYQEKKAREIRGRRATRESFLDELQKASQICVDSQKPTDRKVRKWAIDFIVAVRYSMTTAQLVRAHVGRNPAKDFFGKPGRGSWFKSQFPEIDEFSDCRGNIAKMMLSSFPMFEKYALAYSEESLTLSEFMGLFGTCEKSIYNIGGKLCRLYYSVFMPETPISGYCENGKPVFKFDETSKRMRKEIDREVERLSIQAEISEDEARQLIFVGCWRFSHYVYDGSFCFYVMRMELVKALISR